MRKKPRCLASALIALALPLAMALGVVSCSGDDKPDNKPIAVEDVKLDKDALALTIGTGGTATGALTATVSPDGASNKDVEWKSGDIEKVTVTNTGLTATVTAVANTAANTPVTVSVTTKDGDKVAECKVTVTTLVEDMTLDHETLGLEMNGVTSAQLAAAVLPATASNRTVAWTIDPPAGVATVSSAGLVTAVGNGAAIVTATPAGNAAKAKTCAVTVITLVEGVTVAPAELTLKPEESETLEATVLPATATNPLVVWSSSDSTVATVSEGGAVTAVAPGDATITAKVTSVNGAEFSGTCAVTVEKSIVFPTFAAGGFHSLAIKTDGSLWAWGGNGNGQLGGLVESWDYWYVPNRVDDGDDWIGVWAGIYSSMAIKTDGSLWAWGNNWFGMLGYGHDENRTVPTRVGEDSNWASVAPGVYHTMAIKTDGSLWGAGVNWYGQLGVGEDYEDQHAFKRVGDENDWAAVAVGNAHTLALKKNGSLWAWGSNWTCQLGNGTGQNENVPIRVDEGTDWVFVAAGGESSLAIKSDGSLWAWGTNQYGVLGIGDDEFSNFPAHVGNGYAAAAIGCNYHTIAVKTDGSLWASGANWHGELGIGESHPFDFERHTFTQVGTAGGWAAVTAGDIHSLAIKTDGSLWAWGDNEFGTLGLGDTNLRDTPAEVGTGFRAP